MDAKRKRGDALVDAFIILEGLEHATKAARDRPMFLISDYNFPRTATPSAFKD